MFKIAIATFAILALANAASLPNDPIPILKQVQDANPEGNYHTQFETGNGINYQEDGAVKPVGDETPIVSQGTYSYQSPEGVPIQVSWTADENGFHAEGDHLPVPPPTQEIPLNIARALEWSKTHPYVEPKQH